MELTQLGVSACSTPGHSLPIPPMFAPGPVSLSCCAESAGSVVTDLLSYPHICKALTTEGGAA